MRQLARIASWRELLPDQYASTVHMYCIYPAMLNKRLLDDDKSIWNNFVYVFENNIPDVPRWVCYMFYL
jgi:hypothetical protein